MMVLGLTGGIGSGKTTVSNIFRCLGVPVFDSDAEAKMLLDVDVEVKRGVMRLFGEHVYQHGKADRKVIADLVFNDQSLLDELNQLIHPVVKQRTARWVEAHHAHPFVVKEAAILFESGAAESCDRVICVTASVETRIHRVMRRDQVKREDVVARMNKQWSDEQRAAKSDFVVNNEGHIALIPQVISVYESLLNEL
jgi:dephospho-CoA kinase